MHRPPPRATPPPPDPVVDGRAPRAHDEVYWMAVGIELLSLIAAVSLAMVRS